MLVSKLISWLIFLLILGILVFVHELGHYLAARRAGVKVEEFFFGFGPKLWSKKIGETLYGIKAFPIGGYVLMLGEDKDVNNPRSLTNLDKPRKTVIMVAGVLMNFIFAWILITVLYLVGFDSALLPGMAQNKNVQILDPVKIEKVESGSPAAKEGIQKGDIISTIDGVRVGSSSDVFSEIYTHLGKPVNLVIRRGNETIKMSVTPRKNPAPNQGALGIEMVGGKEIKTSWRYAPIIGLEQTGRIAKLSAQGFGSFVKQLITKRQVSQDVTGIVGIGIATDTVRKAGITYLMQFVALISVSLAVINLVPMAPLDGGQVLILAVEAARKKKLTDSQLQWIGLAGLGFIVLLFVVVTYQDFLRYGIWSHLGNIFMGK